MSESPQTLTVQDEYAHLTGRDAVHTPSRFRNRVSKYRVFRSHACTACGTCAELCPYGVHVRSGDRMLRPREWLCIGTTCRDNDFYCVNQCPEKALSMTINPLFETLGDVRWPADMIAA
ncbi:MAG: 4Fe-4S binding protein, partial [Candidatus Hydrogenedentota bacterium]